MRSASALSLAFAISVIAFALQLALWEYIDPFAWLLFYPAVIVAAILTGVMGGITVTVLSSLLTVYAFIPPRFSFAVENPKRVFVTICVVATGIAISFLIERMRQLAERIAAQGSELRFRRSIEEAPFPIMIHADDGSVVALSRTWTEISGYALQDIPTIADWTAKAYGDGEEAVRSQINSIYDFTRRQAEGEHRIRCRDGSTRVWEISSVGLGAMPDGKRIAISMAMDVTERNRVLEALKESEERWKFALEGAGEGVWDWNIQTGEASYSKRWKEMIGFAENEIKNSASEWSSRVHPEDLSDTINAIQAHIDGKTPSAEVEFRMSCKDGSWKWILGRGMVVSHGDDGKPLRLVGTNTDITERKLAEAELIAAKQASDRANLAKSRFLAAASHDLRQPIQAINLFQVALSRTSLTVEQKRISDYLSVSAQNLGGILDALLDISKLDAGMVKPNPRVVRSDALFRNVDSEFAPLAAAKSLGFKLHLPPGEMAVVTDPDLFKSLLGNLIGNAIKYTERGGVLVGIRRRGNRALIQVWDSGVGIAPEHTNAVFDEYFQIGNAARDRTKGLGLGLSIAKRLAMLLETNVACRSRPGKGSLFEFSLPLAEKMEREASGPIGSAPSADNAQSGLAGRHVVVIDDHLLVASATKLALELHDMNVTTYGDAAEALASPEITNADFYVCDYSLPGMNGAQLLQAIQERSARAIRAVLLTGNTSPDQIEITKSSPWKVLFKPVNLSELLSAIEAQDSAP